MKIKLAVSSCLLGEKVRYDGGHKELETLTRELSSKFDLVSICPEMLMGLGVPREPIYARESESGQLELKARSDEQDLSILAQETYHNKIQNELKDIVGYIFKSRSPSCALRALSFNPGEREVSGFFAHNICNDYPYLVVVDETDLQSNVGMLSFVVKVLIKAREIDSKWAYLFEQVDSVHSENFFAPSNLLKSTNFPDLTEFNWLRLLANRLSS